MVHLQRHFSYTCFRLWTPCDSVFSYSVRVLRQLFFLGIGHGTDWNKSSQVAKAVK